MTKLLHGRAFTLNDGAEYIFPGLTLRQVKEVQGIIKDARLAIERLAENAGDATPEDIITGTDLQLKIAHMSLSKNYPAVTIEQLEDLVNLATLAAINAYVFQGEIDLGKSKPAS